MIYDVQKSHRCVHFFLVPARETGGIHDLGDTSWSTVDRLEMPYTERELGQQFAAVLIIFDVGR